MAPRGSRSVAVAVVMGTVGLLVSTGRGDIVILKDGYVLHGKVNREKEIIIDKANGRPFITDRINGLTMIDDGPRWTFFPAIAPQLADISDTNRFKDHIGYSPKETRYRGDKPLPGQAISPTFEPWDLKQWTRNVVFIDSVDNRFKHTLKQHVSLIHPHYIRVGSSSHAFTQFYLTKEFGADRVRSMLMNHHELKDLETGPDPARRERLFRFWVQADWLEEAAAEFRRFERDCPTDMERRNRLRAELDEFISDKLLVEVERARESGRHQWVIRALEQFPKQNVPQKISVRAVQLQAQYASLTQQIRSAKKRLEELPKEIADPNSKFMVEGAAAIAAELHLDSIERLERFVILADQAERDQAAGRKPEHTADQLLAAAITGWHLGKVSASTKIDSARKCWTTRLTALDVLRNPNPAGRKLSVTAYEKSSYAMGFDEVERLVSFLPPPEALADTPATTMSRNTGFVPGSPSGIEFELKLPEEYTHSRSYPVLIMLPDVRQTPKEMMDSIGDLPSRYGYIVASPKWLPGLNQQYRYTDDEQMVVMHLLRHLRRTLNVDSDRVFLLGHGEGATMALDVAGAHPDLFAGLIPMNPNPLQRFYIPNEIWFNYYQVPMYFTTGAYAGNSGVVLRQMLERWMPHGFSVIAVSYKGRGSEWFAQEVPNIFDWMSRKRRAEQDNTLGPKAFLGSTPGFRSVRPTNNRFHWLEVTEFLPSALVDPEFATKDPSKTRFQPTNYGRLSGRYEGGNQIYLKLLGVKTGTVWIGKGMVDTSKPITVRVNDRKPLTQTLTPSISVLLEDIFARGDRQRPYFERIEFKTQ